MRGAQRDCLRSFRQLRSLVCLHAASCASQGAFENAKNGRLDQMQCRALFHPGGKKLAWVAKTAVF